MNEQEFFDAANLSRLRCAMRILQENHLTPTQPEIRMAMNQALKRLHHVEGLLYACVEKNLKNNL